MLSVDHLTVAYEQNTVIPDFCFRFEGKKIYAILGRSGSGKSTLLSAIAGILPHGGDVTLEGQMLDRKKHYVSVVAQNRSLIPWQTLGANIAFPAQCRGCLDVKRMAEICAELGISPLLNQYPDHVSGGEAQRAALARAFLIPPDLLLLDESFASLDAITLGEVYESFRRVYAAFPALTLMVTHNIEEALYLADTILIYGNGSLRAVFENEFKGLDKYNGGKAYRDALGKLVALI